MRTFSVSKKFAWSGELTERVAKLARMFGVSVERLRAGPVEHRCKISISDGDIVYIAGPSGAGKSVLLAELERAAADDEKIKMSDIELPSDRAVIDCIKADFVRSLGFLSKAGLSDVFCMVSRPADLSAGQQYRFRLAMAMADPAKYVFADEFCSNLDRISAAAVAYNIRRFAKRSRKIFFLASSHDDILAELQPDVLVVKELNGLTEVIYKDSGRIKE